VRGLFGRERTYQPYISRPRIRYPPNPARRHPKLRVEEGTMEGLTLSTATPLILLEAGILSILSPICLSRVSSSIPAPAGTRPLLWSRSLLPARPPPRGVGDSQPWHSPLLSETKPAAPSQRIIRYSFATSCILFPWPHRCRQLALTFATRSPRWRLSFLYKTPSPPQQPIQRRSSNTTTTARLFTARR
jgi:hypothetical protein